MANDLFDNGAETILNGDVHFDTDTIRVTLLDGADDTPNLSTDDFYDDIAAGARVATANLASVTTTDGVLDAADTVLSSVTGDQSEFILLDHDAGGAESADPLLVLFDTATGLPVTPNGADITIQWNASGILDINPS
jgi:hypothetical protein